MEVEQKLRELLSVLVSSLPFDLAEDELSEIKDIIKYSDDPKELESVRDVIVKRILEHDVSWDRLTSIVDDIVALVAEIVGKDELEIKGSTLEESLRNVREEIRVIKERLECIERRQLELVRMYVVDLIHHISEGADSADIRIITDSTLDRLEREPSSLFQPEIFRRIQDIILEKEREIEIERNKLREQLKKVLKSIISTINSISDSENMIIGHLNEHLSDIENVLGLDNLDEIMEKLTHLSARLKETIRKTRGELRKTRQDLNENAKLIERLKAELDKYKEMAIIDELTGVFNRRGIMELLRREVARSERFKLPLSVAMVDIDDFKKVNDTFGHITGDKVLKAVATIMKSVIRKIDMIGRYGGEEFLVIFPNTPKNNARIAAEKLRKEVESHKFKYKDREFKVTISIGVAEYEDGDSTESLIAKADEALYRAKSAGKNRVEVY